MDHTRRLRQLSLLGALVAATVVGGMVGFRLILHETWFQSLYRAVITASLTGLDTIPPNNAARALSIVMVVCGLTIIGYAATRLVAFPMLADDVGNWLEPLGVVSIVAETVVVASSIAALRCRRLV